MKNRPDWAGWFVAFLWTAWASSLIVLAISNIECEPLIPQMPFLVLPECKK